jgi:hypothetical protein
MFLVPEGALFFAFAAPQSMASACLKPGQKKMAM